jgi:predicted small metal-binding protein
LVNCAQMGFNCAQMGFNCAEKFKRRHGIN